MGTVITLFSATSGDVVKAVYADFNYAVCGMRKFHYVGGGLWHDDNGAEYEVFRG